MFRYLIGGLYALIAVIFLCVNSYVLGSFGHKWSHDPMTQWGFALIGGAIPWGLAPILHVAAAKRRAFGYSGLYAMFRGTMSMIPFLIIYVLFVGYNVLGGTGATAFSRSQIQDEREHVIDETARLKKRREAKQTELDDIPAHRPADTVASLMQAHRKHKFWSTTNECGDNEIRSKAQRDYCAEYFKLDAERLASTRAAVLQKELDAVDADLNKPQRAVSKTDPQIQFLADLTGADKKHILFVLLLATPLVLEAGALYWGGLALELLGIRLSIGMEDVLPPVRAARLTADREVVDVGQPIALGALSGEDRAMQMAVLDSFLSDCLRHAAGAQEAEHKLLSAYTSYAAGRNVLPVDKSTFRKVTAQRVRFITTVGETTFYCGVTLCDPPISRAS